MPSTSTSFDPTSVSSTTASALTIIALFCMCMASYNMGKTRDNRSSSLYQLSWWSAPSAVCILLIALCIFFNYD